MIFRLLGPLTVSGAPAPGGPRVRALLALLLLDAGRTVTTGRLVDGVYGTEPPAGAANALQSQVSRLRRVLPEGVSVEHSPAGYRLTGTGPEDVDALRFEHLAREGALAGAAGDPVRAARLLREALGLWQGPALADVREFPYADGQAARLEALRLDALEACAEARLASGEDPAPLVRELAEAAAAHPLRERLRALQIRALAGAGRQAEALAAYEEVRGALAEELGADPSPELAAAHLAVLRGEGPAGAAVRDAARGPVGEPVREPVREAAREPARGAVGEGVRDAVRGPAPGRPVREPARDPLRASVRPARLPAPLTEFVGREAERERLGALLAAAAVRLVTLVGPGGAGKTRLALEAAGRAGGEAVFVDLGAVGRGEAAGAFARALGVRDTAAPDRLAQSLADRPVLLVVDNCEHVIAETAPLVRELLAACPSLRALATSREALGITGESLLPLGALAPLAAEELFVRRGAAALPGFTGHPRVAEVCAALDGLPLAVELAAARLRTLTVDELADRLGDRFRLLSRGDRTAPERHRTLAAVVEWSWSLLTEEERTLAARLAVFRGGATAEAAARVCGVERADAEDVLASLTEKSLVERVPDGSAGGGRYRMLETVRAYAADRLPADDPAPASHTAYYLGLARTADPELRGAAQLDWLARLDAEDADLRAALRRATPADGLRLVAALTPYWWLRGLRGQVSGLAAELLERVEAEGGDGFLHDDGLGEEYALCVLASRLRDERRVERARGLLTHRDEPLRQPFTAFLWATSVGPEARLPVPDDAWSRALDQVGRGHLALGRGEEEAARTCLAEALEGFRALGERWGTATALEGLAALSDEPLPLLAEALALFESLGVAEDVVDLLLRRAVRHETAGEPEAAAADRARATETARRAGLPQPA
ncbi:AfsR/SARP family transcriptional regulator [Streptomyces sp. NBC_01268]|uniref:AfsR/SARP family transcriptional regulator n=1 Tax=Streptomyces sp. NBC_01268 TaxID=2903806 RepID=UPI002E342A2D|nr:BTAD domain-containing putative transcriptional regulator [Streptomyces sp. NBC_01268]